MNKYKTKNIFESIKYALNGMKIMIAQRNMIIYYIIDFIFMILNVINKSNKIEWTIFIIVSILVYAAETINTSIENIVDKLEPNTNIYAKKAKDLAASFVLIFGINFLIVEIIILI